MAGSAIRVRHWSFTETSDHNIKAFGVRDDLAKLAETMANYPKLPASDKDDEKRKRKGKRAKEKAAE